jgi:hypothetical protein
MQRSPVIGGGQNQPFSTHLTGSMVDAISANTIKYDESFGPNSAEAF